VTAEQRYVVLTPVRNERPHLEATLASVVGQTVPPALWLVLDDGSSDGSAELVERYRERHPWIRLVSLPDRGFDLVGQGVAELMNRGLRLIADEPGAYLAKLDGDVEVPERYFEELLAAHEADPSLAICSGHPFAFEKGRRLLERHGDFFPSGTARLYRRRYLDEIGGFVNSVGWDTVDILKMRMRGYRTRVLHDLQYHHRRRMGTRNGYIDGMLRDGRNAYLTGYGPFFFLCRALFNARYRPYLLRTACMLWGFASVWMKRTPRIVTREEREFHLRLQRRRMRFEPIDGP